VPDQKQKCKGDNEVIGVLIIQRQFVFGIR
jgi:hypothetical protein